MLKVVIITYYWPPMGGGGVQRWLKTTKYLRENGVEPIIFTAEGMEVAHYDESLEKEVPQNIEVHRIPIWEPFDLYRMFLGSKKKIQTGFLNEGKKNNSVLQKVAIWIRGNLFIPDAKKYWIKPSIKYLNHYLKNNEVDVIVSSGPPHSTHLIAQKVSKKHFIPWLADFRDPWTNIDFYHKLQLSHWANKKHKRLEKNVLLDADKVITVSWSWAQDFKSICGRKDIEVITNGYDPADFKSAEAVELDKKFTITHAGSMNADRNPIVFWKALGELMEENHDLTEHLQINLIGPVDFSVSEHLEANNLNKNCHVMGNLAHSEVVITLCSSQVLLLPLNDTPNIDGVVPGKLYEYLGAKRPIICIGKTIGDAAKIIKSTNAGEVIGFKDLDKMKQILKAYYNKYLENSLHSTSVEIETYSRRALAKSISETLKSISTQQ